MTTQLAPGWTMDVERGPECLFVKLDAPNLQIEDAPQLAESLWDVVQQHFANRLVLELDQLPQLTSYVIGQLVLLHKRLTTNGKMLRICGLSQSNQETLRTCRLSNYLASYRDRQEAVGAYRPANPR